MEVKLLQTLYLQLVVYQKLLIKTVEMRFRGFFRE